jgi:predicted Zn-dependent protease
MSAVGRGVSRERSRHIREHGTKMRRRPAQLDELQTRRIRARKTGNWKEYVAITRRLITRLAPEGSEIASAHMGLANYYIKIGQRRRAIKALEDCVRAKSPKHAAVALNLIGSLYFRQHQWRMSALRFQRVVRQFPGSPQAKLAETFLMHIHRRLDAQ